MELEGSGEGFTSRPVVIAASGEIDSTGREIEEVRRADDEAEMIPDGRTAAEAEEAEAEALARGRMAAIAVGSGGERGSEEEEVALESNLEGLD